MADQKTSDIEAQIKLQWNSKPSPGYKLKYYNYFSDRIDDQDFKLSNYVKLHESIFMPNLNFYQKYKMNNKKDSIKLSTRISYLKDLHYIIIHYYNHKMIQKQLPENIMAFMLNKRIIGFLDDIIINFYFMKIKKLKYNQLNLNKFHQLQRKKKPQQAEQGDNNKTNCSSIKKKVRDIERQLSSGKLPENIVEIQKEKLDQLQQQLIEKQKEIKSHEKTERYFQIKYGKIKSFELKKLSRKLKQILKKLQTASEEERQLIKLEEDKVLDLISYIKNYPKDKKYISVFGKNNNEHAQQVQQDLIEINKQKVIYILFLEYKQRNQKIQDQIGL